MKNIQVKSIPLKSNTISNNTKDSKLSSFNDNLTINNSIKPGVDYNTLTNTVFTDVDRILSSAGLNISVTKSEVKAKKLMDINFYEDKNCYTNSNTAEKIHHQSALYKLNKRVSHDNKINIQLNFGSEKKIKNKRSHSKIDKYLKVTPNSSSEKVKEVSYYKEILKEKERIIQELCTDLNNSKLLINKLLNCSNNSDLFDKENFETRHTTLSAFRSSIEYTNNNIINHSDYRLKTPLDNPFEKEIFDKSYSYRNLETFNSDRRDKTTLKSTSFDHKKLLFPQNYYSKNIKRSFRYSKHRDIKIANNPFSQCKNSKMININTKNLTNMISNISNSSDYINNSHTKLKYPQKDFIQIDELVSSHQTLISNNENNQENLLVAQSCQDLNNQLNMIKLRTKNILNSYCEAAQKTNYLS